LPGVPLGWASQANAAIAASLFNRLPTGGGDLEANDFDRLGAGLHGLAFRGSKPGAHDTGEHIAIEPMDAHKQCLGSAMRAGGE
jgi:hypothetical protein